MKPSVTCHTVRRLVTSIRASMSIDSAGLMQVEYPCPSVFLDTDSFRVEWFLHNLLRKREVDRPETGDAALAAFLESERRCATIEKTGSILADLDWLSRWSLLDARRIAHKTLGSVPSKWFRYCTFTGGASTSRKRSDSHPAFKWWARPSLHVTPLALEHLIALRDDCEALQTAWGDPGILSCTSYSPGAQFYTVVPGSRLEMVEKNYKTKRVILIEPDGNMLLQKGVGNIIRERLKGIGINLNDQTRNQKLAYSGSISGTLGTVDLSAASDSVTLALLRLILPEDWYELIYQLRSPCYSHNGSWHTMRKVSSMGNGFTFELESLVFYCLTQAVVNLLQPVDTRIGVYGDDIIVASSVCGALESVFQRCGFSFNREKSFWRGPFRESCGKHYHSGADVTPVYVKKELDCISQRYRLYNQVRSWAGGLHYDPRYAPLLDVILETIPKKDRCQVPVEYGPLAGLHYRDVSERKVRYYIGRDGIPRVAFFALQAEITDLSDRVDSEAAWLYRHVERWVASCPLGTSVYTPLTLVREGELKRQQVVIPACRVMAPIP